MIWIDPDRPGQLFDSHPLWSRSRPAPVRFRRADYGDLRDRPLGEQVRDDLVDAVGHRPAGAVRMLSQPRVWGWLFNPITVYLAWDLDGDDPVGAVAEVTNTPWKERHRYPVALRPDGNGLRSDFPKQLHVSPFLDERYDYVMRLASDAADRALVLELDVVAEDGHPTVETRLEVERRPAERANLSRFLVRNPGSTHRVSAGIHVQAARLWAKGVPFVTHPGKRGERLPQETR